MTDIVTKPVRSLLRQLKVCCAQPRDIILGGSSHNAPSGVMRPGRARLFAPLHNARPMLIDLHGECRRMQIQPGQILFVGTKGWHRSLPQPGSHRCFKVIWDPAYTILSIDGGVRKTMNSWHSERRILSGAGHVIAALDEIADGRGNPSAAPALVQGLLQLTLADLLHPRALDDARLLWQRICDYLRQHFHEPIDRNLVAAHFGIHPNHCSRLFRREGGEGFQDHLARLRLQHAAALIDQGVTGNAQLAERCGYNSANYFASAFRRYHGCSPGEYARFRSTV